MPHGRWADSVYINNPDEAERTVNKLERGELQLTKTNKAQKKHAVKRLNKRRVKPQRQAENKLHS